jgi:signal transduction histidine kinase
MRRPRSLRGRLTLTVVASVAAALVLTTVAFNVLVWNRLSASANSAAYARANAELASLAFANDHLVETKFLNRLPLPGQAWVFVGRRVLESPRVNPSLQQAVRDFAAGGGHQVVRGLPRLHARLYLTPVILERQQFQLAVKQHVARDSRAATDGSRAGVVVVAISLRSFEATRNLALAGSVVWALSLLVVVTVAAHRTLGAALKPVADMAAAADAWSEHESNRRFGSGGPYEEIGRLAVTLDRLLDRIAAALRREQRFSAEVSHELRTPLARITAEVGMALHHERSQNGYRVALTNVLSGAQYLSRTIDTIVLAAQQDSGTMRGRANAQAVVAEAVEACSSLVAKRNLTVAIREEGKPLWLGVDAGVAVRTLQPVLQNACCYATANISVEVTQANSTVAIEIADDGPGVTAEEADEIFTPGVRGSAAAGAEDGESGAGLGLSLARRLAEAADGVVTVVPGSTGLFVVTLPAG